MNRIHLHSSYVAPEKRSDGDPIAQAKVVPFLVEDELKRLGGLYEKANDWQPFAVVDGRLITGQNPVSSQMTAEALLDDLKSAA